MCIRDSLEESVSQLVRLLGVEPAIVAHDLHPDFHSTRFAADFAQQRRLPLLGVQHHHAHAAAVLAEHGMLGSTLALSLDGVGLGTDGAASVSYTHLATMRTCTSTITGTGTTTSIPLRTPTR